jgi:hypothetical protein
MLPQYMQELTMSGNEDSDKKNIQRIEKFRKGDSSMADLRGLAGELAMKDKVQARTAQNEAARIANQMGKVNLNMAQQLENTKIQIGLNQGVLSDLATKLAQETDPQKRELLQLQLQDSINNLNQLGQPRRDAIKAELKLQEETSKAAVKTMPIRTENIIKGEEVKSKQLDVEDELFDIFGISELAKMKADDLKTLSETKKAELDSKKALAVYYQQKGMSDLITAASKSSPTFKDQFKPIVELQGSLLSKTVEVPGENRIVKFSEYLDLHKDDRSKYPMTGLAGEINAQIKTLDLSAQNLLREQQVQVNVPDEAIVPTAQKTQAPVPAYKQAMQRMEEKTQQEYMDTPGVGGMGFPFMP